MPLGLARLRRHGLYIDEEQDRDALFACGNLVIVQFAAEQMKVTIHSVESAAGLARGALLMGNPGGRGHVMREYRDEFGVMGPPPGPDWLRAWQGQSAEELVGEACQLLDAPNGLDGLDHAAY
jgi:hypothetical protein